MLRVGLDKGHIWHSTRTAPKQMLVTAAFDLTSMLCNNAWLLLSLHTYGWQT